jgi:hypothetical protein
VTLDSTAREANARDSFRKFMIDNVKTAEGIDVTFDRGLNAPNIQGTAVTRWVAVNFGSVDPENVMTYNVRIFCCTRSDPEGFRLVQMRDKVVGCLTDSDLGIRRITLYKSNESPWLAIGAMLVFLDRESEQMEAEDGTKFKIIPIRLKWGAII